MLRPSPTDRRILRLAVPALGALAVEPLYVLVDTAIVGRLGTDQLAGIALAATVLSFVVAGSNFLTYGTTERVARRLGAADRAAAAEVGVNAMWLSLIVGVIAAPLLVVLAEPLGRILGGDGVVLGYAIDYLRISALGVPFVLVTLGAQGVLRGAADYVTPLVILVVANAVNVVLEIVMVFVLDLGVPGSAWSTVIAQVGAAIAFFLITWPRLAPAPSPRPHRAGIAPLVTAGKHLLLRVGSMLAVFGGATAVAARIDAPTLAAHQVVMSLFLFLALSLDALAVPAQTLVADELGRDDRAAAAFLASRAVRLSVVTGAVLAVVLALLSGVIPHAFTSDQAVIDRATSGLLFLALMMVPAAVAFAYDGILIGAGDYRFLGLAALGYLIAVTPLGVAVLALDGGIAGIWAALCVWMLMRAVVNHLRTSRVLGRSTATSELV